MELPNVGSYCSKDTCNKLDFLPVKCDGCELMFCNKHVSYENHDCPSPKRVDNQVPECPLCQSPVPVQRGKLPDVAVNEHIERNCQFDVEVKFRTFLKCSLTECANREIPIVCRQCGLNFCIRHRHPMDHKCYETAQTRQWLDRRHNYYPKYARRQDKSPSKRTDSVWNKLKPSSIVTKTSLIQKLLWR